MAKGRIVYEPGELDRVRKNLGDLDHDEAKRMAKVLGGEVGLEREAEAKKRAAAAVSPEERAARNAVERPDRDAAGSAPVGQKAKPRAPAQRRAPRPGAGAEGLSYSQRVKMDFRCSQGDFLIKTQGQVLESLFSFVPGTGDGVNSYFITTLCSEIFTHLEALVDQARIVFPAKRVEVKEKMGRWPGMALAMEILAGMNLDALSRELGALQRNPRAVGMAQLVPVAKRVFVPIMRLRRAYEGTLLKAAAARSCAVISALEPESSMKCLAARDSLLGEIDYLFLNVAYRWYPLLMRLCCLRYREYLDFYVLERDRILAFLGLTTGDVLPEEAVTLPDFPGDVDAAEVEGALEGEEGEKEGDEAKAAPAKAEENAAAPVTAAAPSDPIPQQVRKGLAALDTLFPESGWGRPEEKPDLYPYFNHLYPLPKGSDLISPADPLIQAIVLAYVLHDLLQGFRNMEFGTSQDGEAEDLETGVNALINEWMSACDEIIPKRYLPLLSEYCRLIETEREAQGSTFAAKREADLLFYKKRYFLPFTKGGLYSGLQNARERDYKPLFKLSQAARRYLEMLAKDIDLAARSKQEGGSYACLTIRNAFAPARFEVENAASERLRLILKNEGPSPRRLTNAALIYYSLVILHVLDFLLNSPESWAYRAAPGHPYRALGAAQAPKAALDLDPERIFQQYLDRLIRQRQKAAAYEKQASPPASDQATASSAASPTPARPEPPEAASRGLPKDGAQNGGTE
jgi:hypothetical protein